MTHKTPEEDWHSDARSIRLQLALRRRWLSFISVFAVACVAVLLMMFSVRWRATLCQSYAKNVELIMFTKESASIDTLRVQTNDILLQHGFKMSPPANKSALGTLAIEQFSFLDTSTRQLRESSLELRYSLRTSIEKRFPYEYMLRYISQDICLDRPPFPLDAEYNVDEDYATSSTKAVSDTETTFYYFQSAIRTAAKNKIKNANDVSATFPSTRGVVMGGPLVASETCQVTTAQSSRVYFSHNNAPLPSLMIKEEEWVCCEHDSGSCRSFNGLRIVHHDLEEEVVATKLYRRLRARFELNGYLCGSSDCGVPLYQA